MSQNEQDKARYNKGLSEYSSKGFFTLPDGTRSFELKPNRKQMPYFYYQQDKLKAKMPQQKIQKSWSESRDRKIYEEIAGIYNKIGE